MPFADEMLLFAFICTLSLAIIWLLLARRWNIYDTPEQRRLHRVSTVRGGGISIAIVMLICSIYIRQYESQLSAQMSAPIELVIYMLAGATFIGLVDDLFALKPGHKLLSYALLALLMLAGMLKYTSLSIWLIALMAIALVLQLNVWNFMDGSNGLISIQAILLTLAYLLTEKHGPITECYAFAFLACCLAFLPFNYPKARMFLGDVGSHALGAAVFGLFVLAYQDGTWGVLQIMVLSSTLWIDAVFTFLRRYFRGYRVARSHRSHLYQYLVRSRQGHTRTALWYAVWTFFCMTAVYLSVDLNAFVQALVLLSVLLIGAGLHQYLRLNIIRHHRSYSP
jgi:UDP-N-acetylmuramyl pentapeptide phosphotransferase/UDP-N-acetylglucosamine-1-phosphate transferase